MGKVVQWGGSTPTNGDFHYLSYKMIWNEYFKKQRKNLGMTNVHSLEIS